MPNISFVNQLGFNRTSRVFLVGENLELHARFVSGPSYSLSINRIVGQVYGSGGVRETCVPDSVLRVSEGGGVTLLKLVFNDAKSSDDGIYSLTVAQSGQKMESKFPIYCTSNGPTISNPPSFRIFDSSKNAIISVTAKVSGTADDYNWLGSEELGAPLIIFSELAGFTNSPTLRFSPMSCEGNIIYLQAANFFDDSSEGDVGDFRDDIAYYGVCAKPAVGWVSSAILKERASRSLMFNVTFPTPLAAGAMAYVISINERGELNASATSLGNSVTTLDSSRKVLSYNYTSGEKTLELLVYRSDTKEAKYIGRTALLEPPTIGAFLPAGPILCKSGAKVKLIAPNAVGTGLIEIEWFFTSDNGKSWQSIGKGEIITHAAKTSGLISCRATNKFGSDFSDTMLTLTVSPRASGEPKKAGQK